MSLRLVALVLFTALTLAACATSPTPIPPTAAPIPTSNSGVVQPQQPPTSNLEVIKTYLLTKTTALKSSSAQLAAAGQRYYDLAKDANFDYTALWNTKRPEVTTAITDARAAWKQASPTYEQMEGIVAGVSSLSSFDTNLDAGTSAAEGGDNVVTFDLKLPDGRVLEKPGNLFGITESTLWGTDPNYSTNVKADFNNNGQNDLGDILPEANILSSSTAQLNQFAIELDHAANQWQPTDSDAFTALVANVPTVGDFFESWKTSRFVLGDQATHDDFVVISRLSDIVDNISSWQAIYSGISPTIAQADPAQDAQIQKGLNDLKAYVSDIYQKEQNGKRFTPEEADTLSVEAQNRATAIAGQLAQIAAQLNIPIKE